MPLMMSKMQNYQMFIEEEETEQEEDGDIETHQYYISLCLKRIKKI